MSNFRHTSPHSRSRGSTYANASKNRRARQPDLPRFPDDSPPLFCDAPVFEYIEFGLLPQLADSGRNSALRIWLPRCSSGEDAYSMGMLALNATRAARRPLRILASDIDQLALEVARRGIYPHSALSGLNHERRAEFFVTVDDRFAQVTKELRNAILFSSQNILTDIPFSRLDMIFAPGLLGDFEPSVQRNLLCLLHFALREGGSLILGKDESASNSDGLFAPSEEYPGVFHVVNSAQRRGLQFPILRDNDSGTGAVVSPDRPRWLQHLVEQRLLEESAPAAVVIDSNLRIVSVYGPVHIYLDRWARASEGIVDAAGSELRPAVLSATCRALQHGQRVTVSGEIIRAGGERQRVNVVVRPIGARNLVSIFLLVTFTEDFGSARLQQDLVAAEKRIEELTRQLHAARGRSSD